MILTFFRAVITLFTILSLLKARIYYLIFLFGNFKVKKVYNQRVIEKYLECINKDKKKFSYKYFLEQL